MIPGFSSIFIIWWKVATHPSILYVSRKYRSQSTTPLKTPLERCLKAKTQKSGETVWSENRTLEGRAQLLPLCLFFFQNIWENLIPPFNIYCGGLASLVRVPQGTLSHTHLGSDTVALNETWRLHLGLSFQSDAVLCCIPPPSKNYLSQEVELKSEIARATPKSRWEESFPTVSHQPPLNIHSHPLLTSPNLCSPFAKLQYSEL